MITAPAWLLIGYEGAFRLPGGRTAYEAVMPPVAGERPRLARLVVVEPSWGAPYVRQVNRYVAWDQPVEVIEAFGDLVGVLKDPAFAADVSGTPDTRQETP